MRSIFVAGTDTDVGKSLITGLIARLLLDKGYSVVTQKWAGTGSSAALNDIDVHLKLMGRTRKDFRKYLPCMMPYLFKFPASPHLAARLDHRRIDPGRIKSSLKRLAKNFDFVIIEGTGGLLVPLRTHTLLIDLVRDLKLPVVLVAPNRLGTINHTLLSIEAIRARKIEILGVIFNNLSKGVDKAILRDNPEVIKKISGAKVFGELPWIDGLKKI